MFLCAALGAQVLRRYGLHVYQTGGRLYELRHLFVIAQQRYPLLRPVMSPAWLLVSQWEELQPVAHRKPLPEVLFRGMVALAIHWRWKRFAGCLLLRMEGIACIGEVLRAHRFDLVLPMDMFEGEAPCLHLRINKPKTLLKGKGRVQHIKIETTEVVHAAQCIFGQLSEFLPLFPFLLPLLGQDGRNCSAPSGFQKNFGLRRQVSKGEAPAWPTGGASPSTIYCGA